MIIKTNYLLSIDPSIINTGFCLWERKTNWKPIWISSYNFSNFNNEEAKTFYSVIENEIAKIINKCNASTYIWKYEIQLVIERGFSGNFKNKITGKNSVGRGKETLEHLRGFLGGTFNKLLIKEMLVHNLTWKKWYKVYFLCQNKNYYLAWNKDFSIKLAGQLIKVNDWSINVKNHDQAEALLIGWYYINVEPTVKGKCK